MASSCRIADRWSSTSEHLSQLYAGVNDLDDDYRNNCNGEHRNREDGWRLFVSFWRQRNCVRKHRSRSNDLRNHDTRGELLDRGRHQRRWCSRDTKYHANLGYHLYNKFLVGVLSVVALSAPVNANEGQTVIANPQATSSGQVSNQAVQINQGGYSKQGFSQGHFCNSSTLTVSPFFLGNDTHPNYVRSQNYGLQLTMSFPLDGGMVEACKALARKRLEKERLDYMLIRALKCAELLNLGYMIHPNSPYAVVCSDVVPIAREPKSEPPSSVISAPVSQPASEQVSEQMQGAS